MIYTSLVFAFASWQFLLSISIVESKTEPDLDENDTDSLPDTSGRTALHIASDYGSIEIMQLRCQC
jgi:ankyrin repeat protein